MRTINIDYPPAFCGPLHEGHLYQQCLIYPFYNLLDKESRERIFSKEHHFIFENIDNIYLNLNIGMDTNGLPISKAAQKRLKEGYTLEDLNRECRKIVLEYREHFKKIYEYTFEGLRSLNYYETGDDSFKENLKTFLDYAYLKGYLKISNQPHVYCSNCKSFLSKSECSYKDQTCSRYLASFKDASGQIYPVMTTRPEFLSNCVGVIYHPSDSRYHHLKDQFLYLDLLGQKVKAKVYPSEWVRPTVGTGLVYITMYQSELDIKACRDLGIKPDPKTQLYTSEGSINPHTSKTYDVCKYSDFFSKEGFYENIKIDEPDNTIHVYRHTERGDCLAEVQFISTEQLVLDYPSALLNRVSKKINSCTFNGFNLYPKDSANQLKKSIESLKEWCISRSPYNYGFPNPSKDVPFKCVIDTWVPSSLTFLQKTSSGQPVEVWRLQGTDIIDTWLKYSILNSQVYADMVQQSFQSSVGSRSRAPFFKNVYTHRMVLDSNKTKISKSRRNGIDLNKYVLFEGATRKDLHPWRFYFNSKPTNLDFCFNMKELGDTKRFLNKLDNVYTKVKKILRTQESDQNWSNWFYNQVLLSEEGNPESYSKLVRNIFSGSFDKSIGFIDNLMVKLCEKEKYTFYEATDTLRLNSVEQKQSYVDLSKYTRASGSLRTPDLPKESLENQTEEKTDRIKNTLAKLTLLLKKFVKGLKELVSTEDRILCSMSPFCSVIKQYVYFISSNIESIEKNFKGLIPVIDATFNIIKQFITCFY